MKHIVISVAVLVLVFVPISGLAYDATGMWDYTEHTAYNNCGFDYTPESGEMGILQNGSSFLIVDDEFSTYGTVSGTTYTYSDAFCMGDGHVELTNVINLTSETTGTGTVSWIYYEGSSAFCSGGHQISVTKQPQAAPLRNASGRWNYTQSGFSHNCESPNTPNASGYFIVTQSDNKITVIDDEGNNYGGYVNGSEYAVVRSYSDSGGRTTEWYIITLSSETEGSGQAHFVWDDDCYDCGGTWNISVTKDVYTITATATAGGTISPSGPITVDGGSSQVFQINAGSGYIISDVLVDNVSVGAVPSYTFANVSANHTIHAEFLLDSASCESLKTQGFESGIFPPGGWGLLTTNQGYTWQVNSNSPHTGNYAAEVLYDPKLNVQDEVLLSQQLLIKEAILHFWSMGSIDWCRDTFDNCDLEIWIVVGSWDGGAGDDIFVGKAEDAWINNFEWADSSFNLTSLLPDKPIRVGFRYKGADGAQVVIDDIQICSDMPAATLLPFIPLLLD